ncbi:MAG: PQQ-binding-like beta-propeller repeat protein [Saprospiraceae bacterium]|nr:PQQ-binding-like beta-propeller repeat protein [Saprospiraceae bacterium]
MGFPKPGEYGKNSSIFGRYSADTGALLWHFDVSEPGRWREWEPDGPERAGEVRKFLGVWQGRLYVAVSNGLIIELDVESGQLLRSWQQLPDGLTLPPSGWNKLHGVELAFLDVVAGEIACVTHQYYWRIDLESGALHFHDLREHFSAAQLQVSPPAGDLAFDAEHIYFASEYNLHDGSGSAGTTVHQLAALHRHSGRIAWQ